MSRKYKINKSYIKPTKTKSPLEKIQTSKKSDDKALFLGSTDPKFNPSIQPPQLNDPKNMGCV